MKHLQVTRIPAHSKKHVKFKVEGITWKDLSIITHQQWMFQTWYLQILLFPAENHGGMPRKLKIGMTENVEPCLYGGVDRGGRFSHSFVD